MNNAVMTGSVYEFGSGVGPQTGSSVDTLLCVDSASAREPWLLGLGDEALDSQPWLKVLSDAHQARQFLKQNPRVHDAWVYSSDSVDAINLAAAIKQDGFAGQVSLLAFDATGSVVGRCQAAGIKACTNRGDFVKRYGWKKQDFHDADTNTLASVKLEGEPEAFDEELYAPASSELLVEAPRNFAMPTQEQVGTFAQMVMPRPAKAPQGGTCIMVVMGGSGGVGRSTFSAVAGSIAQARGFKTLVVDGDLQFGDMATMLDEPHALDIMELLANPGKAERIAPQGRKPAVLAAPSNMEFSEVAGPQLARLVGHLANDFEVIVVNTGAFWQESHLQLIELATHPVMLFDQRPASVRGAARVLDLCANCGIATRSMLYALNRCARKSTMSAMDVSCALHGVKVQELSDGGAEVSQMLGAGMIGEFMASRNAFIQSMESFLSSILPAKMGSADEPSSPQRRKGGFRQRRKRR